jgi:hypothetical protein
MEYRLHNQSIVYLGVIAKIGKFHARIKRMDRVRLAGALAELKPL